jgi:hypothetical protein
MLQLAQFPLHRLQKWDSALNGALLFKAGSSLGAYPAMIHASRKEGGLGVFSFTGVHLEGKYTVDWYGRYEQENKDSKQVLLLVIAWRKLECGSIKCSPPPPPRIKTF